MTDMTVFDHRASIVAFLTAEAKAADGEAACHTGDARRWSNWHAQRLRDFAAQIARCDDIPAGVTSPTESPVSTPLPPLRTVGPMQNRGAQ